MLTPLWVALLLLLSVLEDSAGLKCKSEDSATPKCKREDTASPKCKKGLGLADGDDNCFDAEDGADDNCFDADDTEELEEQRLNAPSPKLPSPGATPPPSPGTARALADVVSYNSKQGIGGFRMPVGPMGIMPEGQADDLGAAAGGCGDYSDGSADEDLPGRPVGLGGHDLACLENGRIATKLCLVDPKRALLLCNRVLNARPHTIFLRVPV